MSCGVLSLPISLKISLEITWMITRSPCHCTSWKVINSSADARGDQLMLDTTISSKPIASKISDNFWDHTEHLLDDVRTSMWSNFI
jgi:hypothetical protein